MTKTVFLSLLIVATGAVFVQAAPNYRLQSTAYAVTITTSHDSKIENCRSAFGEDASLLDMTLAKADFSETEFDEALTGVFFKSPNAAFYVAYEGSDSPPGSDIHYALSMKSSPTQKGVEVIDSFGKARVETYPRQAQLLCSVPVKEYEPNKPYASKEQTKEDKKSSFTMFRLILGLGFVGVALLVRKRFIQGGMGPATSSAARGGGRSLLSDAYYNVLDQKAGGNNPFDYDPPASNDLATSLTEGCELSYNPAQQGLV